jgi:hypothetical protein
MALDAPIQTFTSSARILKMQDLEAGDSKPNSDTQRTWIPSYCTTLAGEAGVLLLLPSNIALIFI